MEHAASKNRKLYSIVIVGFMASLVYVGNYLQIPIPNGVLITRIHLANSMCLLAGLLFGRMKGGLASGIGASLFDLFSPIYLPSAPYTFLSKFAMGFLAGHLKKHSFEDDKKSAVFASVCGQLLYIILYTAKTFIGQLILGEPMKIALGATGLNALTSTINGIIACAIAIPLYSVLSKALKHTGMGFFITEKEEKREGVSRVTAVVAAIAAVIILLLCIYLSYIPKLK